MLFPQRNRYIKLTLIEKSNSEKKQQGWERVMGRLSSEVIEQRKALWQQREVEYLQIALDIIDEEGFSTFSMDQMANKCQCSKGTLYRHFSSKEDCLAALAIQNLQNLIGLFKKCHQFEGNAREQILSLYFGYQLHVQLNLTLFGALTMVRTPAYAEKVSDERNQKLAELDLQVTSLVLEIIRYKKEQEGIQLPEELTDECCLYLFWSLANGINHVFELGLNMEYLRKSSPLDLSFFGANAMLDGLGIPPLSRDFDYRQCWQYFEETLFSDEVEKLQKIQ